MPNLTEKIKNFPQSPGVYQFLDKNGGVIYVGKAKNLRSRIRQYFGHDDERPQIPYLMAEAHDIRYTVVHNELESAFLENTVIKQYSPKYNIELKDDKNYAFITISYSTEIPQIGHTRKIDDASTARPLLTGRRGTAGSPNLKSKIINHKSVYFGPYSAAWKIKNTLNLVRKIFPFCAAQKVSGRPCFYYYMHRCPGVCVGKITLDEYQLQINKIIKFLQGDISSVVKEIKSEMALSSKNKKFETAARLRDQLQSLEILLERQNVIMPKKVDWDIVSLAHSDGYACINLFKIREGKMFDKENFVFELPPSDGSDTDVIQSFLERYYLEASSFGKCIYIQLPSKDPKLVEEIIHSRFSKKAEIGVPQKGKILKLVNLGKLNAEEHLKNWLQSQAGHLDKINKALEQLKEVLNLPAIPKRIECYDISNTQGSNPVGSMVVFKDGLPAKSEYRKFKIQGKKTPDDFAMMKEMLSRRLERLIQNDPKFPMPDLIVIDGGKGQLGVAVETINNLRLTINTIGLAKRIEEIFLAPTLASGLPNQTNPIILSHDQPALQMLQRLRDEAHRFGITFHRQLRSKQAIKSALDEISGVGPKTKKLLKSKFGTVSQIKNASLDELALVVGKKLAEKIKNTL